MGINKLGLKRRLEMVVVGLEDQAGIVRRLAHDQMVKPEELRTRDGNFMMIPLLTAQAHALSALQALQADLPDDLERGDYARTSE